MFGAVMELVQGSSRPLMYGCAGLGWGNCMTVNTATCARPGPSKTHQLTAPLSQASNAQMESPFRHLM